MEQVSIFMNAFTANSLFLYEFTSVKNAIIKMFPMLQERERATSLGYEDPINPSFEATTAMYEKVLCEVLEQTKQRPKGKIAVMVASHNEDTVRYTVQK